MKRALFLTTAITLSALSNPSNAVATEKGEINNALRGATRVIDRLQFLGRTLSPETEVPYSSSNPTSTGLPNSLLGSADSLNQNTWHSTLDQETKVHQEIAKSRLITSNLDAHICPTREQLEEQLSTYLHTNPAHMTPELEQQTFRAIASWNAHQLQLMAQQLRLEHEEDQAEKCEFLASSTLTYLTEKKSITRGLFDGTTEFMHLIGLNLAPLVFRSTENLSLKDRKTDVPSTPQEIPILSFTITPELFAQGLRHGIVFYSRSFGVGSSTPFERYWESTYGWERWSEYNIEITDFGKNLRGLLNNIDSLENPAKDQALTFLYLLMRNITLKKTKSSTNGDYGIGTEDVNYEGIHISFSELLGNAFNNFLEFCSLDSSDQKKYWAALLHQFEVGRSVTDGSLILRMARKVLYDNKSLKYEIEIEGDTDDLQVSNLQKFHSSYPYSWDFSLFTDRDNCVNMGLHGVPTTIDGQIIANYSPQEHREVMDGIGKTLGIKGGSTGELQAGLRAFYRAFSSLIPGQIQAKL